MLIPDWKKAWKLFSVQIAAVSAVLDILADHLPMMQYYWPDGMTKWVCALVIVGRLIKQEKRDDRYPRYDGWPDGYHPYYRGGYGLRSDIPSDGAGTRARIDARIDDRFGG